MLWFLLQLKTQMQNGAAVTALKGCVAGDGSGIGEDPEDEFLFFPPFHGIVPHYGWFHMAYPDTKQLASWISQKSVDCL